jgi:hypothetical protein
MAAADPANSKQDSFDEVLLHDDEFADDEMSDGVVSLLEENARLRGLVVKLSDIILRHVNDRR